MLRARWVRVQEPAAPLFSASTTISIGSPSRRPRAMASATAMKFPATSTWFTALARWPAPTGPKWVILLPTTSSNGRARSTSAGSPPTSTERVPAFAPSVPPVTGASM